MDMSTLKGLSTLFFSMAFFGMCWWAFSPSRKKQFQEAANLPFADDVDVENQKLHPQTDEDKAG